MKDQKDRSKAFPQEGKGVKIRREYQLRSRWIGVSREIRRVFGIKSSKKEKGI